MTERLLQYIWKNQLFNREQLTTASGEELTILFPGHWNFDQGPDFLLACIKIGNTILVGNIELHLKASDWMQHQHHLDAQYNNVVLHVVLHQDSNVQLANGAGVAVLDVSSRISRLLLDQYQSWMHSPATIACGAKWDGIPELTIQSWKDRLITERWMRKIKSVQQSLTDHHHWDELLWHMLAANFGLKANTELFASIATSLPYLLIAKNRHEQEQLEALLFGQAHLLDKQFTDDYPISLQAQYQFLKKKYRLMPAAAFPVFLRMRPAAFPTIRLSQLAALLHKQPNLFSKIVAADSVQALQSLFAVQASDYWLTHYRFDEMSAYSTKRLGADMIVNICINTVLPVLFCYGQAIQDSAIMERAYAFLMQLPAESNKAIRIWQEMGIQVRHAADCQALLELRKQYCDQKKCLDCALGHAILYQTPKLL